MYWVNEFSRGGADSSLPPSHVKPDLWSRGIFLEPPRPADLSHFSSRWAPVCIWITAVCVCYLPDLLYGGYLSSKPPLRHSFFCWSVFVKAFFRNLPHSPIFIHFLLKSVLFFLFFNIQSNISRQHVSFPHRDREIDGFGQRENWVPKAVLPHAISVAFLWPSWKGSCWNSRGASVAFRLPCHPLLISIPPN